MVVPAATALVMSFQAIFASLFVSILGIRRRQHPPLTDPAEEAAGVVDAAAHKAGAPPSRRTRAKKGHRGQG